MDNFIVSRQSSTPYVFKQYGMRGNTKFESTRRSALHPHAAKGFSPPCTRFALFAEGFDPPRLDQKENGLLTDPACIGAQLICSLPCSQCPKGLNSARVSYLRLTCTLSISTSYHAPPVSTLNSSSPKRALELFEKEAYTEIISHWRTLAEASRVFCGGGDLRRLKIRSEQKQLGAKRNGLIRQLHSPPSPTVEALKRSRVSQVQH